MRIFLLIVFGLFFQGVALESRESAVDLSAIFAGEAPKNAADLRAMEKHIQGLLDKIRPCTVGVSGGSGVVVSKDGLVLSVAHVGRQAGRTVTITFPDGRRVKGKTLGNDSGVDAGLMKITDEGEWPFAEMSDGTEIRAGQWCLAIGYPVTFNRGQSPAVRLGRVLRTGSTVITTDCTIMGGDSGGPLFDMRGRVIGISSRCNQSTTRNYHVPVSAYRRSWKRLTTGEDFNSRVRDFAFLGVAPVEGKTAAEIGRVVEGSAAEKAGLEAGDVIVTFGGHQLKTYEELRPLVMSRNPGEEVEVVVRRGEKTMTLNVTLGKR